MGAAAVDGLATCGLSLFVSGSGTAKTMAKIANSKAGEFTIDIVQSMIVEIIGKYEPGKIKSFSDIDLTGEFIESTFKTLLSKNMGKRADELLESLKQKNSSLYNKLAKLRRNQQAGKTEARIKSDRHKVDIAQKESARATSAYVKEEAKVEFITENVELTNGRNEEEI